MIINTTSHDSYDASYFDMRMINHVITVKTGEIHRLLDAKRFPAKFRQKSAPRGAQRRGYQIPSNPGYHVWARKKIPLEGLCCFI